MSENTILYDGNNKENVETYSDEEVIIKETTTTHKDDTSLSKLEIQKDLQYKKDIIIEGQLIVSIFCTYNNTGNTIMQSHISNNVLYEKHFEEISNIINDVKKAIKNDLETMGLKVLFV